jgi:hypothetical protein
MRVKGRNISLIVARYAVRASFQVRALRKGEKSTSFVRENAGDTASSARRMVIVGYPGEYHEASQRDEIFVPCLGEPLVPGFKGSFALDAVALFLVADFLAEVFFEWE